MQIKKLQTDEEFVELLNYIVLNIRKACRSPCNIRENKGLYKRRTYSLCKKEENIFKGTIIKK